MDPLLVIEESLDYIEANLESELSLDHLAKHFNFSKYYFHRLFSAVMGLSLKQYILNRKLNASLFLIKQTDQSLTEIGSQLHFSTPAAFSRAFKRQYDVSPSSLRKSPDLLKPVGLPPIVQRPIKHLNGDLVTDFSIEQVPAFQVSGLVFRVDIMTMDYIQTIQGKFSELLAALGSERDRPGYVIYSDCSPDQTVFNVIVGVKGQLSLDLPMFFSVDIPEILGVQFTYSGELYYMSEVLNSDLARFLRIARVEAAQHDIHMIQHFESIHDLSSSYQLFVPIKEDEWDG